jgi:hypothetical protein
MTAGKVFILIAVILWVIALLPVSVGIDLGMLGAVSFGIGHLV